MNKFSTRGFASLLLSVSFLIVVVSGLVLWVAQPPVFGLDKGAWKHMHIFISLLMIVAGAIHVYLNWSVLVSYLWKKTTGLNLKREAILALAIPAIIICTAIFGGHGDMSRFAAMTLPQLAQQTGKPVDQIVSTLEQEGLNVDDQTHSLLEIATDNNVHPMVVVGVIGRLLPHGAGGPH